MTTTTLYWVLRAWSRGTDREGPLEPEHVAEEEARAKDTEEEEKRGKSLSGEGASQQPWQPVAGSAESGDADPNTEGFSRTGQRSRAVSATRPPAVGKQTDKRTDEQPARTGF